MDDTKRTIPPYIPWQTFLAFIERMKATAVPPVIDHTVLPKMNGTVQAQLRSALKFLGLMEGKQATTEQLKAAVSAYQTDQWQAVLAGIVQGAYAPIIGDLDISHATSGQLDEAFRSNGSLEGQVRTKAVRFYLLALSAAGVTASPHIAARGSSANGNRGEGRKPTKKRKPSAATKRDAEQPPPEDSASPPPPLPPNFLRAPFPLRENVTLDFAFPRDLTKAEVDRITTWLGSYASA